jgi:hypothetical protein
MGELRIIYRIIVGKPEGKRSKCTQQDNVMILNSEEGFRLGSFGSKYSNTNTNVTTLGIHVSISTVVKLRC